jgi:hypothetical protein
MRVERNVPSGKTFSSSHDGINLDVKHDIDIKHAF